ncbi:hypothetical protein FFLO_04242 [Filobasidium floriforme]|uniref:DUF221-domain-containing protein n=1 Tax=Filobasidium floriforme TaxID=5210 RepID=A0A8K0NPG1_9TREE|nr:hypothetical protein FFLO_04242 [Filobasidium floriforme]
MSVANEDTKSATKAQFISALVVGAAVAGALGLVLLVLSKKYKRVYESRMMLATDGKRPPPLPTGFALVKAIIQTPDDLIIEQNGLDAYLFVRFIKVFGIWMLVPYFLLTWIILMPVTASKPNAGNVDLNIFSIGNVPDSRPNKRIAHLLVGLILIAWTCFLIYREFGHLIKVRQAWLSSHTHQRLARTRTVQLVNVPEDLMAGSALVNLASSFTGASERNPPKVWLARNTDELQDVFDDRNDECNRLEAGEAKLLSKITKNVKKNKTPEKPTKSSGGSPMDTERADAESVIDRYLTPKEKGKITWKQGLLGLIGRKMDRQQSPAFIREKNGELERLRSKLDSMELGNVAWLRFHTQNEAHVFARNVNKEKSRKNIQTGIEVVPEDIIWNNTSMNPHARQIGKIISWSITIGLIIIWGALSAFVGAVSNVDTLCTQASWLAWLCTIPGVVLGIIKGVLPAILYAILFAMVPIFLRFCLKKQGIVRNSDLELNLFSRYFAFELINGFLVVTVASGLMSAIPRIVDNPGMVTTLLATELPGASIFFLTLLLTRNLSGAGKTYSRVVAFVMQLLKPILGGKTPRKFWLSEHKMDSMKFGVVWPPIALIVVIVIVYSVIQPVITGVGLLVMALLWFAYKYVLGWCADQPDELETGGLYYPRALNTIFTGLYLEEICLAGLFFLSTGPDGSSRSKAGLAGGVLFVVAGICTIAFHIFCKRRFPMESILYTSSSLIGGTASTTKLALAPTAEEREDGDAGPEYGQTTGWHDNAFDHPATWKPQPIIWLAKDQFGVSDAEVARINGEEVEASNVYAELDTDAKLHVERSAPDEEHQHLI